MGVGNGAKLTRPCLRTLYQMNVVSKLSMKLASDGRFGIAEENAAFYFNIQPELFVGQALVSDWVFWAGEV